MPKYFFLEAKNLSFEWENSVLFEGFNLEVSSSEMILISGSNGIGKTTLLRLLAGLTYPSSGVILIKGHPIHSLKFYLNKYVLWIGHELGLKRLLTVKENLDFLNKLHCLKPLNSISAALDYVGLPGFEDILCQNLSVGQKARVSLARLYLIPRTLWILDEPFTALDKEGIQNLEQHLLAHCEQGGITILTTHNKLSSFPTRFRSIDLANWCV